MGSQEGQGVVHRGKVGGVRYVVCETHERTGAVDVVSVICEPRENTCGPSSGAP